MRLEYHPAVATELREVAEFYNSRSAGLGTQFLDEFERQMFAIAANPGRWMILQGDVRRCLMKRFPYVICYRFTGELIRVTVVKHQKRHPQYGSDRR